MICKKCGTEFMEGIFCPECGMKYEEIEADAKKRDADTQNRKGKASISSSSIREHVDNTSGNASKKKISLKILLISGAAILFAVVVIFIAANWEGKVDYVATVKAHTPFAVSQELPYTYEEVLTRYMDPLEWKVREEGNVHYVDISGTVKGINSKFTLTIRVSENPDNPDGALIEPVSVTLDDMQASTEDETARILYNLFCMYDEGYEVLETGEEESVALQGEISLTETFTDEDSGISFLYPSEWVVLDSSGEFHIAEMIDSRNTPDHIASFNINMIFDQDPYGVFTGDETSVREAVREYHTFLGFGDTMLGDIPAKVLKYQTEGLNGDNIVLTFWYMIGGDAYQVTCSCTASTADIYEPVFEAIMSSYRVNSSVSVDSGMNANAPAVAICFKDIPVEELLNFGTIEVVQRFGSGYYANGSGGISYDEIEFYMLDDETVGYIWSFYPECFSINGNKLNVNNEGVIYSDEIIELLGSDYEDESLPSGYYMTYRYPTYTLSFGINKFSEVSDIRIYNLIAGNNDASVYASDDISAGDQEPVENYSKLSGAYSDSMGMLTLSLSIYTSQEEGETEIGTADIYANNGQHYIGAIIPTAENVYKVETDTGEEVLLVVTVSADSITLELYVDGQYLEEYRLEEHYES